MVEDSCLNEAVGKERGGSNGTTPLIGVSLDYAAGCLGKGQHECVPTHIQPPRRVTRKQAQCFQQMESSMEGIMNGFIQDDEKQKEQLTDINEQG